MRFAAFYAMPHPWNPILPDHQIAVSAFVQDRFFLALPMDAFQFPELRRNRTHLDDRPRSTEVLPAQKQIFVTAQKFQELER
jgi:hypothetical protein